MSIHVIIILPESGLVSVVGPTLNPAVICVWLLRASLLLGSHDSVFRVAGAIFALLWNRNFCPNFTWSVDWLQ